MIVLCTIQQSNQDSTFSSQTIIINKWQLWYFFQRRKKWWVPYRIMVSKDIYSGSIRVFDEKDTCTVYWSHRFCFFGYMFNCWNKFLADVGLLNANWAESNRWVSTLPRIWSMCPTPMRINLTWMETKKSPEELFQEIEKNYEQDKSLLLL